MRFGYDANTDSGPLNSGIGSGGDGAGCFNFLLYATYL